MLCKMHYSQAQHLLLLQKHNVLGRLPKMLQLQQYPVVGAAENRFSIIASIRWIDFQPLRGKFKLWDNKSNIIIPKLAQYYPTNSNQNPPV